MDSLPSLRLTVALNAMINSRRRSAERSPLQGDDVAHHVVDPDDRLGLEATQRLLPDAALPVIAARESDMWVLALPVPGAPGRCGDRRTSPPALAVGEVVVAGTAGLALVPHPGRAGRAVAGVAGRAAGAAAQPARGRGALSETVIAAAEALGRLEVAAGTRPSGRRLATGARLQPRQLAPPTGPPGCSRPATPPWRDAAPISSCEAEGRLRELRRVRAARRGRWARRSAGS